MLGCLEKIFGGGGLAIAAGSQLRRRTVIVSWSPYLKHPQILTAERFLALVSQQCRGGKKMVSGLMALHPEHLRTRRGLKNVLIY